MFEHKSRVARIRAQLEERKAYLDVNNLLILDIKELILNAQTLKKALELGKNPQVQLDVTNEALEENFKNQRVTKEKYLEELSRSNQKKQHTILEAKVTLKTVCHKLDIVFTHDEKDLKSVPYQEVATILYIVCV